MDLSACADHAHGVDMHHIPFTPSVLALPVQLKILTSVFHGVAISCTLLRLAHRLRILALWWEDLYAGVALIFDVLCLACVWLEEPSAGPNRPLQTVVVSYLITSGFTSVVWTARLSILWSAVRVSDPGRRTRLVCQAIGLCFWVMWIALVTQKFIICHQNGCVMGESVAISQLVTDSISDIALVVLPIWLLREVKLCARRRVMVLCAFSASLSITVVTIAHSIILFGDPTHAATLVANIKTALSLVVCNLLVIVAFIYKLCGWTTCSDRTTFTTIDLNQLCTDPDCNLTTGTSRELTLQGMIDRTGTC
ncbi:hypothetical protein CONPUDRAFT_92331 [Coniophora puteana RWD-64-598 SS2]|uniref:Rhodopsin domain-containing protein n=1 Tax=Coniophora puteana (strain RWD-64-598) TaxID=741705 RepID=A0A5M3MDF6_CONPW|nr:uncharacterized protein CONPUDRAFT_92331 [Coniophora puteana RWD-64-598 SS2]EIW77016.1 hypothetical protein CONPUDRAFT_92331 [Coniophora puteana RWD-64-598 SS2]